MKTTLRLSLGLCTTIFTAAAAMAAEPAVRLERGYVLSSGAQVKGFRVPTVDANGVTRYFDVVIDLSVNDAGRIGTNAVVTSVKSPAIPGDKFVAGVYQDFPGGSPVMTCTVSTSILNGSRQEGSMSCQEAPHGYLLAAAWTTGDIPGHPFELDLRAAGIDAIPGYQNYAWGKVGIATNVGLWGCFTTNDIISARQVGNQIALNSYDSGNIAKCGVTLTLLP